MNYIKHLEHKIYHYSLKYHFEDPSVSEQKIIIETEKSLKFESGQNLIDFVYMQAITLEEM